MIARLSVFAMAAFAGCSSATLPAERFYGLAIEPITTTAKPVIAVLRVLDLQPAGGIDRDHPMITAGVQRGRSEFDRWIEPVDRLITDAVVVGLSRRRVAALVKTAIDPGAGEWTLHGRILEFAEVREEAGNSARITLDLWVMQGDDLLFRDEFHERVPLTEGGTTAAVGGLSLGLGRLVEAIERRLRAILMP